MGMQVTSSNWRPPPSFCPYTVFAAGWPMYPHTSTILSSHKGKDRNQFSHIWCTELYHQGFKRAIPPVLKPMKGNVKCKENKIQGVEAFLINRECGTDDLETSRLPLVIRERDVEYQLHRILTFQRLLQVCTALYVTLIVYPKRDNV